MAQQALKPKSPPSVVPALALAVLLCCWAVALLLGIMGFLLAIPFFVYSAVFFGSGFLWAWSRESSAAKSYAIGSSIALAATFLTVWVWGAGFTSWAGLRISIGSSLLGLIFCLVSGFLLIVAALAGRWLIYVVSIALIPVTLAKPVANYAGYCTTDSRFWNWKRLSDDEILRVLNAENYERYRIGDAFRLPTVDDLTGDNHEPTYFSERVFGAQRLLVFRDLRSTDPGGYSKFDISYFDNCVGQPR